MLSCRRATFPVQVILLLLGAGSFGCGGSSAPAEEAVVETEGAEEEAPPPPPPPPPARVRLIHAAFDPMAAAVSVSFDGEDALIHDLAYQRASEYVEVTPGDHALSLVGPDGTELLNWTPPTLAEEASYTVVLATGAEMPVLFGWSADVVEAPRENTSAIRIFHGLSGPATLDVCLAGESARADGILIFANLASSSFAGEEGAHYAELPSPGEEVVLQLRASNARACHGRVQGVARFTPITGSRYTLVATGSTGRGAVNRELLICADPPASDTSCAAVAITAR